MNLPFLRFFKKDKAPEEGGGVAVAPRPVVAIEKPASERFGKTVMPNASRIVGVESDRNFSLPAASGPTPAMASAAMPSTSPGTSSTAVLPGTEAPAPAAPRKISLGGSGGALKRIEEPRGEGSDRTIALPLADLASHIPEGTLQTVEIDPERRILFKASEIERGMASGRPAVRLRAIYQQASELFTRPVGEDDKTQVALPVAKVLEQFASFTVRPDQLRDPAIPQMDTPFLKMTVEDSERFGTSSAPLSPPEPAPIAEPDAPSSSISTPPSPARPTIPAPTISAAPSTPAPPATELKPIKPIRLSLPTESQAPVPAAASPDAPRPEATPPQPLLRAKLSPNGIGVPASERVPASSGPPVPTPAPTPLPSPFAPPPPAAHSPSKIAPLSNDLREPVPAAALPRLQPRVALPESASEGPHIQLPLRSVLRGIAPVQLSGPVEEVPETTLIQFPFADIEPQLALGRVAVSPAQFQSALPEEFRTRFKIEDAETPIPLPLQEVLQHLPDDSLRIRGDQEVNEVSSVFETPFSQKAAEDAARFSAPVISAAQPPPEPAPEMSIAASPPTESPVPAPASPVQPAPALSAPTEAAGPVERSVLQTVLETDEALDPKSIVAHASRLPGVKSCAIMFSDGLSLAGNIPVDCGVDALCALAPIIVQKIGTQIAGANLGPLTSISLFCAKAPVSFFAHENICLAALHAGGEEIAPAVRARLSSVAQEVARMYGPPA